MLGTWTLNDEDERDSLAYLIRCLPADGRYEIVVRQVVPQEPADEVDEQDDAP